MNRKKEISLLNVILCLAVIFIHVTSYPIMNLNAEKPVVKLLYFLQRGCGFAVYGFIFLSGLKLFISNKKVSTGKYYLSRIKRVYIPYLIAVFLYYLYEVYRGYFVFDVSELLVFFLNGNVECHLYFVVIIMQFYLLYPLWKKMLDLNGAIVLPLIFIINIAGVYYLPLVINKITGVNFIYNDRVLTSYIFFWLSGCFAGKYYEKFSGFLRKKEFITFILFAVFLYLDVSMSYNSRFKGIYNNLTELVHQIYCGVSVLFFMKLVSFEKMSVFAENKLVSVINELSFEIYLSHIFFISLFNDLIGKISFPGQLKAYVLRIAFVYPVCVLSCFLYKKIKNILKIK